MSILSKSALEAKNDLQITTNGNNEITGAILNGIIDDLIDSYEDFIGSYTTVQIAALVGMTTRQIVYDTTLNEYYYYNGSAWVPFAGSQTLRWVKVTKSYSDFATAATTNDIEIYSLPTKGVLHQVIAKHNTSFTGGSISVYIIDVGRLGNLTEFIVNYNVFGAPGATTFEAATALTDPEPFNFSTATSIRAQATSTSDDLDAATQGSVDFYLLISTLP